MDNALNTHFGLKFHPFHPDVPADALHVDPKLASFLFRVEQQVYDGGFVAVVGDPGTGKSAALRVLTGRLGKLKDVSVAVLTRPQSSTADFYRELGHLFGVTLSPHNRWAGAKVLRETWLSHIDETRTRPVVIIDEAQEMKASVLGELRLLSSMNLDARALLTVVLGGDERLTAKFRTPDMLPVASRIRTRLHLGYAEPSRLREALDHVLKHAGRPDLLTDDVKLALATHAHGNLRTMMTMADNLLAHALENEHETVDEQAFFELFQIKPEPTDDPKPPRRGRRHAA